MNIENVLSQRCESKCELCTSESNLSVYEVPPVKTPDADTCLMLCDTCRGQIESAEILDVNHWHCLNGSMWSEVPAVKVMVWRMLKRLSVESWAQDLLDILYLDEDVQEWAEAGIEEADDSEELTLDSNGAVLQAGDTVTLIKDLDVKGGGFTAKRGTAVRGISLTGNPEQIEGRVNGVRIVLLTKFLKKSS